MSARINLQSSVYDNSTNPTLNLQREIATTKKEVNTLKLDAGATQTLLTGIANPVGIIISSDNIVKLIYGNDSDKEVTGDYIALNSFIHTPKTITNIGREVLRAVVKTATFDDAVQDDDTTRYVLTFDDINLGYAKFLGSAIAGTISTALYGEIWARFYPHTEMAIPITDIGYRDERWDTELNEYPYVEGTGLLKMVLTRTDDEADPEEYFGYYVKPTPTHLANAIQRCVNKAFERDFITCTYNSDQQLEIRCLDDTVTSIGIVEDSSGFARYTGLATGVNVPKGDDVSGMIMLNQTKDYAHPIISCSHDSIVVTAVENEFAVGDIVLIYDNTQEATVSTVVYE